MIEVLSVSRCIDCDLCVRVCPTNVFDPVPGAAPVIARQSDCQTCFQCEAYCPVEALYVSPLRTPAPAGSTFNDETELERSGQLGLYRTRIGWGRHHAEPDPEATAKVTALMVAQVAARLAPTTPTSHETTPKEHINP